MAFLLTTIVAVTFSLLQLHFSEKKQSASKNIFLIIRNIFIVDITSIGLLVFVFKYKHFVYTDDFTFSSYLLLIGLAAAVSLIIWKLPGVLNPGNPQPKKQRTVTALKIISLILFILGCAAEFSAQWCDIEFGGVTADQLLINITSPVEGTDSAIVLSGIEGPVFSTVFLTTVFSLLNFCRIKPIYIFKNDKGLIFNNLIKTVLCLTLSVLVLVKGFSFCFEELSLKYLYYNYFLKSDIIDTNYVNPKDAEITFPEKKRNLIYIYLESIENSYLSKDLGGNMPENLMPELARISDEGIIFSDTDNYFGGPQQGVGTQWSLASMVNQTTGLPMKAPGADNSYGGNGVFLPGAYTIGEILENQGYEQTVMIGASAKFGSLDCLFSTHGNWLIFDYNYAVENGLIPSDYKVNWGFEDDKLYEFAKEEITRLYSTGKPFNFTMETADTHFPDGYVSKGNPTPYQSQYANAILNSTNNCVAFIEWIKQQPFYENTTIVLIGDHLSMDTAFFETYDFNNGYKRTQFNLILNPDPSALNSKDNIRNNRIWANWDYFPTVISAIGGKIKGERLGIGTNLFSGKPTLYEEFGFDYVEKELQKGSDLYNYSILNSVNS